MTARSIEFYRSEKIRKFIDDMNTIDRLDLLMIKAIAFLHDLLVAMQAEQTGEPEEELRRRFSSFAKLAKRTLTRPEHQRFRDLLLEFNRIRNSPAHGLITDEFVPELQKLWEKLRGDHVWPADPLHQRDYAQSLFILFAFELGRYHAQLPPSPYILGTEKIRWEHLRSEHEAIRDAGKA